MLRMRTRRRELLLLPLSLSLSCETASRARPRALDGHDARVLAPLEAVVVAQVLVDDRFVSSNSLPSPQDALARFAPYAIDTCESIRTHQHAVEPTARVREGEKPPVANSASRSPRNHASLLVPLPARTTRPRPTRKVHSDTRTHKLPRTDHSNARRWLVRRPDPTPLLIPLARSRHHGPRCPRCTAYAHSSHPRDSLDRHSHFYWARTGRGSTPVSASSTCPCPSSSSHERRSEHATSPKEAGGGVRPSHATRAVTPSRVAVRRPCLCVPINRAGGPSLEGDAASVELFGCPCRPVLGTSG